MNRAHGFKKETLDFYKELDIFLSIKFLDTYRNESNGWTLDITYVNDLRSIESINDLLINLHT